MSQIKSIFEDYLQKSGLLSYEKLGSDTPTIVTLTQSNELKKSLSKQIKFNNNIIIIAIVLLCIIFFTGIFFVFYYRDSPSTIGIIFGGTLLSLLAIVSRLRKLWLEKSMLDISFVMVDDLPPEEAAKFIQTIYWSMLKNSNGKISEKT